MTVGLEVMVIGRFSALIIIHLTVLVVLGITFSSNSLADYFDTPRYDGEILPISEPIVLRYRAHPKAPFRAKHIQHTTAKENSSTISIVYQGEIQQKVNGSNIEITIKVSQIEVEANAKKEMYQLDATILALMKENGEPIDLKIDVTNIPASLDKSGSQEEMQKLNDVFRVLWKKLFPQYPDQGVLVGDILYKNYAGGEIELGPGLPSLLYSQGPIVHARSRFEGRDVVVAVLNSTFKFGEMEGPYRGYELIDIDTGSVLHSERMLTGTASKDGQMFQIDMYQTRKTNLPPKPAELQTSDNQGIRQRLERVKRLLEQKLITPDEAAGKRREILNSL